VAEPRAGRRDDARARRALRAARLPLDAPGRVAGAIADWWRGCERAGRAAVVFVEPLAKAPRLAALLSGLAARPIVADPAIEAVLAAHRRLGVALAAARPLDPGASARSLAGELVLLPPSASRRRLPAGSETALVSGTMLVRGQRRRANVDRGFALSSRADWPALLATVADAAPQRVLALHGHPHELARFLEERGTPAGVIETEAAA
jgi:putative mRNA 3-end processing factor